MMMAMQLLSLNLAHQQSSRLMFWNLLLNLSRVRERCTQVANNIIARVTCNKYEEVVREARGNLS